MNRRGFLAFLAMTPIVGKLIPDWMYKGRASIDAGYFYCPYIPLQFMDKASEEEIQPSRIQLSESRES